MLQITRSPQAGLTIEHTDIAVVATTIYLSDLRSDRAEVVKAFAKVFSSGIPPTRTIIESSALPSNTDVEVTW